jgi:hypothetical protein
MGKSSLGINQATQTTQTTNDDNNNNNNNNNNRHHKYPIQGNIDPSETDQVE